MHQFYVPGQKFWRSYVPVEQNIGVVMAKFGAWPRDNTDKWLLNELLTCAGEWKLRQPDGGNLYEGTPRPDRDRGGMDDNWEKAPGGNLSPRGHDLHAVYDHIEMYLHDLHDELMQQVQPVDAFHTVMREPALRQGKH